MLAALRLALGLLTALPVKVEQTDRDTVTGAMTLAPWVGLGLGLAAGLVSWLAIDLWRSPPLAAVLAIAALTVLTRALHLDGLADTVDGLGSAKPAPEALAIMRASDIGPFGVVAVILLLLIQVAALAAVLASGAELSGLLVPAMTGRLAVTWACRRAIPAARPEGLGALVAGSVGQLQLIVATGATLLVATAVGLFGAIPVVPAVLAVVAGIAAAEWLLRLCVRRLGGVTGDVLGALVEVATTVALLMLAV
ncbi:MAG: adenosylcobinamide-GDP ribazoletransferase [Sporichthyaceae bacterium]|nr:adenosylcobinamide-GDP ribazoletransferase [Sporichthyaceae bacterium]